MSERRRTTQLAGRNPSIRLSPLPAGNGNTLQPFPQIRGGHRINVDADILGEETRQGLQTSTFKIGNSGCQQNTPAPDTDVTPHQAVLHARTLPQSITEELRTIGELSRAAFAA